MSGLLSTDALQMKINKQSNEALNKLIYGETSVNELLQLGDKKFEYDPQAIKNAISEFEKMKSHPSMSYNSGLLQK